MLLCSEVSDLSAVWSLSTRACHLAPLVKPFGLIPKKSAGEQEVTHDSESYTCHSGETAMLISSK